MRTCYQPNKTIDITGQRFGELTAIRFDHRGNTGRDKPHYWVFRCDCGNEIIARKNAVTSGNTCRCKECSSKRLSLLNKTHGMTKTRLYRVWAGILGRCNSPVTTSWNRYGAKGVSVCEEWLTFENFRDWAFANGYNDSLTIDRIDPRGDYEPSNCRWANTKEQANNKQGTIWIEYGSERMPLSYWADKLGIQYHTLYDRLYRYGWTVDRAFTEPVRRAS